MPTNNYIVQAGTVTDTTITINIISNTSPTTTAGNRTLTLLFEGGGSGLTQLFHDDGKAPGQFVASVTFSELFPETTYQAYVSGSGASSNVITVKTKIDRNTPRVATQEQWEDLKNHVNEHFLSGSGAPSTTTQGKTGDIYVDESSQEAYICVGKSGSSYVWKQITN